MKGVYYLNKEKDSKIFFKNEYGREFEVCDYCVPIRLFLNPETLRFAVLIKFKDQRGKLRERLFLDKVFKSRLHKIEGAFRDVGLWVNPYHPQGASIKKYLLEEIDRLPFAEFSEKD